mgnify:FL=1
MHGTFLKDQLKNIASNENRYIALGNRKFLNFNALIGQGCKSKPLAQGCVWTDKKTSFVFFGDTGEGDELAGSQMLSYKQTKNHIFVVMIHCLEKCQNKKDSRRYYYYKNYAEATQKLLLNGFIGRESANKVLLSISTNKHYKSCQTRYKNIEGCRNLNQSMKELSQLIQGF